MEKRIKMQIATAKIMIMEMRTEMRKAMAIVMIIITRADWQVKLEMKTMLERPQPEMMGKEDQQMEQVIMKFGLKTVVERFQMRILDKKDQQVKLKEQVREQNYQ
jgi:hypothetical protein